MCGRYATTRSAADLSDLFEAFDETGGDLKPDYNVAPTDRVPIVRVPAERGARVLSAARWGLVPFWASDPRQGSRMINARVETVATSRAYASAFEKRRCLVPADGWYEWVRGPGGKQAYFMTPRVMNGEHGMTSGLALAGIWGVKGDLMTFAILTMPALGELARVHDRMPLVLPPQRWEEWLTATVSDALLTPAPLGYLESIEIRPVGVAVGDVRNDGPDLIRPIDDSRLF
jgi:putative SOS response-associated peptidase YedK